MAARIVNKTYACNTGHGGGGRFEMDISDEQNAFLFLPERIPPGLSGNPQGRMYQVKEWRRESQPSQLFRETPLIEIGMRVGASRSIS